MKLADYLYENSMSPSLLRRKLGVTNRSTVWRWLAGDRIPNPPMMLKIELLTEGRVTLRDFLDAAPARCAQVVTGDDGEERLVLPWSPDWRHPREETAPASERLSKPVLKALEVLGGRAWYTPKGTFLLDGRKVSLKRVMRETNVVLTQNNQPLIPYPGVHAPEEDNE